VLGVLYHISSDFDKSIASFRDATRLRPDDAALWNKLGATQANSSRSADAVQAYQRALQLRPGYVRAQANLAIAYANQGLHQDAVRAYLTTLSHNPAASHVWSYLRISLAHMQREDLVELSHVSGTHAWAAVTSTWRLATRGSLSLSADPVLFVWPSFAFEQQTNVELFRPFFQF